MRAILKKSGSIIMALGEVLVGILLIINPVGFTMGIIIGIGILLVAVGAILVISYFRAEPARAALEQNLTKGLCLLLAGAFCIFRSGWFLATMPWMIVFYGVGILLTGIAKVQWAVDAFRMKKNQWQFRSCGAALTLIVAVVVLMNPFETVAVLWTFTAISLIIEAVLDLLTLILPIKRQEDLSEE